MLFEPAQEPAWPADLELPEQLLSLPRRIPRKVKVEVHNPIKHDITLGRRTPLGSPQLFQSVTPLEVKRKDLPHPECTTSTEEDNIVLPEGETQLAPREQSCEPRDKEISSSSRTRPVVLGNLTKEQRRLTMSVLQEEADSFAIDDEDVGLRMNLTLSDPTLIQTTCTSVPRPLYTEVKHYLEDLLNRGTGDG